MLRRLLPKKTDFFDYFDRHIEQTLAACQELVDLARSGDDLERRAARIKDIEHAADRITHECIEALHETFITPIERGDIHRLMKRLDDIVDAIDAAVLRLRLYEIHELREEVRLSADLLLKATGVISQALKLMRNPHNIEAIKQCCIEIYNHENEADTVLRKALARLFNEEKDPITIIKWKEILEILELASDRCEDVANIIQGITIEAS